MQPTAELGPLDEAAALTALINRRREELADLVRRRSQKIDEAAAAGLGRVNAIARRVGLSHSRVSQITTSRRGRSNRARSQPEGTAAVLTAAPQQLATSQEA